jgi:MFS family permease
MTILHICALSLLYHEIYYYALQGRESIRISFMPSLGLDLSPNQKMSLHVLLMLACLCALAGGAMFGGVLLYILFPIYLAAHNWRISNHLMVIFFLLLIDCGKYFFDQLLYDEEIFKLTIFLILLVIYFFGAFHKLNTEFFDKTSSCANRYLDFFICTAFSRVKFIHRFLLEAMPAIIVLSEALIFVFLLLPYYGLGYAALWLALVLHFLFGITGNSHFSVLMLLLLSSFCSTLVQIKIDANVLFFSLIFVIISYLSVDRTQFRSRAAGLACVLIFGALCGYSAYSIWAAQRDFSFSAPRPTAIGSGVQFLYFMMSIMVANCLSPYFWKTEFSLAMFSNLRPDRKNHYILNIDFNRDLLRDRYYEIIEIEGLGLLRGYGSQTVGAVSLLMRQHEDFYYSARFLNEFARLVSMLGTVVVDIKVRRCGASEIETLDVRAPLSAGGLATKFNLFPPYLAKVRNTPYMG